MCNAETKQLFYICLKNITCNTLEEKIKIAQSVKTKLREILQIGPAEIIEDLASDIVRTLPKYIDASDGYI